MKNNLTKINKDQRLYVYASGNGYWCYGFDVLHRKVTALAAEIEPGLKVARRGSIKLNTQYHALLAKAQARYNETGERCKCGLTPQLVGKEGWRVEVVTTYGETRRFIVGKSTGWIPRHLEIARRDSSGGGAAEHEYKSVRMIEKAR